MFSLPPLPRNVAACARDLESKSGPVRLSVARDLGRSAAPEELDQRIALLSRCLDDDLAEVKKQALVSIADLGASPLSDRVLTLLGDPELQVRQMAVMCLGEIARPEDDEVLGRLASLLEAGAAAIRYQALLAYSNLSPHDCESDLLRAVDDEDIEVRRLAVRLIDEVLIGHEIVPSEDTKKKLKALARHDDAQLSLLCQLLCAELDVPSPHDRLIEVVEKKIKVAEPRDEQWSIQLCGRLKLVRAVPGLRRRAYGWFGFSSDSFRWVALGALARLGDEAALARLLQFLRSRNYMQRVLSVQALGNSARAEAWHALSEHRRSLSAAGQGQRVDERELVDSALSALKMDLSLENLAQKAEL